jgi:hypothetical protein
VTFFKALYHHLLALGLLSGLKTCRYCCNARGPGCQNVSQTLSADRLTECWQCPGRPNTRPSGEATGIGRPPGRRKAAKSRGVRFGRPRKLYAEQETLARRLIGEGKPLHEIAKTFNVHVATIYRLLDVPA